MSAVNYQSSSSNYSVASLTVVVTKPTGLAVGDLMIAPASIAYGGGGPTPVSPAGWTTYNSGSLPSSNGSWALFYKKADSTDVAATNFTFTVTGVGTPDGYGAAIIRISSQDPTSPIDQFSTLGSTSTAGITPTTAMGLFAMIAIGVNTSGNTGSYSGYAVVTNNPTWTEAFDTGTGIAGNSERLGMAFAYANQTRISATGTASVTSTSYNNTQLLFLNIMPQALSPIAATFSMPTPTIRYGVAALSILSTLNIPTASNIAQKWKNTSKHVSAWINRNKS